MDAEDDFVRADEFELEGLDRQLEKLQISKALEKLQTSSPRGPMAAWEIDLGKLVIGQVVATGHHGTVFRGTYNDHDVAVKLLDWGAEGYRSKPQVDDLRASLKREVAIWHELNHPNVAKFVGASMGTIDLKIPENDDGDGRTDLPLRACCVVVEFLPGGSLKSYLRDHSRRKLAYKVVVKLALNLARGLSYLHSRKIVHRDVKLENMLFDDHGNLKIIDFGVARVEAQNLEEMTGVTGTPAYMAPEILDGKPYNHKCDIYSFGICLWEIYCCDLAPYINCSYADITNAVAHKNKRPEIPRCCPPKMANIMRRCWHRNPAKRPEMDEVVELLEALDTKAGSMTPDGKAAGGFRSLLTCLGLQ